jgi:hypothetical protein
VPHPGQPGERQIYDLAARITVGTGDEADPARTAIVVRR